MALSEPSRPLRRDAERNRQRILAAARELFAERGLHVTLDDVAHRAGVGVGTVYRRFPDREQLIEALFDTRLAELVELAETALAEDDAWEGLTMFLEGTLALQAADRGFKELVLGGPHGRSHVAQARARMGPVVGTLLARAQQQGVLRPDVALTDLPLLQIMIGAVIDCSRDVEPELYRRFLAFVLEGMRARDGGAAPLPARPLSLDELEVAMSSWRPPRS